MQRGFEIIDPCSRILLEEDIALAARQLYLYAQVLSEERAIEMISNTLLDTVLQSTALAQLTGRN